jgi:hypothetical protein
MTGRLLTCYDEIAKVTFRLSRISRFPRRALSEKHLHFVEIHACKRRWIAPGEACRETQPFRVKLDRSAYIDHRQASVDLLAFDKGKADPVIPCSWSDSPLL